MKTYILPLALLFVFAFGTKQMATAQTSTNDTIKIKNQTLIVTKDAQGDKIVILKTRTSKNKEYESEILARHITEDDKIIDQYYTNTWRLLYNKRAGKRCPQRRFHDDHIALRLDFLQLNDIKGEALRPISLGWAIDFLSGSSYHFTRDLYFNAGLGFGFDRVYFEPEYALYDNGTQISLEKDGIQAASKSRLYMASFRIPLMLHSHIGRKGCSLFIGATPKFVFKANHKVWAARQCQETANGTHFMPIAVDLQAGIKVRNVSLSVGYNPISIFAPNRGNPAQMMRAGIAVHF